MEIKWLFAITIPDTKVWFWDGFGFWVTGTLNP